MLREHCYFSLDYNADIKAMTDPEALVRMDRVIQFPYTVMEHVVTAEDAIARMQEKKREQGRRLQAQAAAVRLQKVCLVEGFFVDMLTHLPYSSSKRSKIWRASWL